MAIDWSDEPDFIKPQNVVELRTMDDAMKLLDQWRAAEADTWREYVKMHHAYCKMKWRAEALETLATNFEFLYTVALDPARAQDREALREAYNTHIAAGVAKG